MKRPIKKDDWNTDDIGWAHKKAAIALTTALEWLRNNPQDAAVNMIIGLRRYHAREAQDAAKRTVARES